MTEKIKNGIQDSKIFWFLAIGVFMSLTLYVYFVGHTIESVVLRQRAEKSIGNLENSMVSLESNYLALKNTVTAELAREMGFTEVSATKYISRKPLGKGLSLNTRI